VPSATAVEERDDIGTSDRSQSASDDAPSGDGGTDERENAPPVEKPQSTAQKPRGMRGFWKGVGVVVPLMVGGAVLLAAVGWLLDQMASNAPSGGGLLVAILAPAAVGVIAAGFGLLTSGQGRKDRDEDD
jgi:hypothetical protein